jgi:type IV secretory pathway VirB10-like protein
VPDFLISSSCEGELGDLPFHYEYAESDAPEYVISFIVASHPAEMYSAGTNGIEALEPLRERFVAQHYSLRKFYYECSNLKYLTGLINVPKLGAVRICPPQSKRHADDEMQDPPNLTDSGDAPSLPARPRTAMKTPPPAAPSPNAAEINEQARMLKEYEDQQKALQAAREAEERRRQELEAQQQAEFAQRQREQAERERLAQEQLMQQQMMQYNNQAAQQASELEREMLAMRGQYERDQLLLEQYDRVRISVLYC